MDRKQFLRNAGGLALATLAQNSLGRVNEASAPSSPAAALPACLLSPSVPAGPFYFNANQVRNSIAEGKPGIPIEYRLTILDANCKPVANALVDIWQCDKGGVYSGFAGQTDGSNTIGQTFLRGIQTTDVKGEVKFSSIYPGWYPKRLTHLHVKIHFQDKTLVTTNLFYPEAINAEVYATALYKAKGANPTTLAQDIELKGDAARFNALMLNFSKDANLGYIGSYTFGIAAQSVALNPVEAAAKGQFLLNRNFPNPVGNITTFTFSLLQSSRTLLEIVDGQGQRREMVLDGIMGSGEHKLIWERNKNILPAGLYFYRLTVENTAGRFSRTMELVLE